MNPFTARAMTLLLILLMLSVEESFATSLLAMPSHERRIVPIYFVSDRRSPNLVVGDFSNDQMLGIQHIRWGKVEVPIASRSPDLSNKQSRRMDQKSAVAQRSVEQQFYQGLGAAMNVNADGGKISILAAQAFHEEFLIPFSRIVQGTARKTFILFVHGCCSSLSDSFARAAELSDAAQLPVLMFDWSTPGKFEAPIAPEFNAYRRSERTLEISQHNFHDLVTALPEVMEDCRCILVAHSMGNRIIFSEMLRQRAPIDLYFEQIHLIRPDLSFAAYALDDSRFCQFAKRVFIYVADNDSWLQLACKLSAGVPRLGAPGNLLGIAERQGASFDSVANRYFMDISKLKAGHSIPASLFAEVATRGNEFPHQPLLSNKYTIRPASASSTCKFLIVDLAK